MPDRQEGLWGRKEPPMRTYFGMMLIVPLLAGCTQPRAPMPPQSEPRSDADLQKTNRQSAPLARTPSAAELADAEFSGNQFAEGRQLALDFMQKYSTEPYAEDWKIWFSPEQPSPFTSSKYVMDDQSSGNGGGGGSATRFPKRYMTFVLASGSRLKKEGYVADIDMCRADGWWRIARVRVSGTIKNGKQDLDRPPNDWYPTWRKQLMDAFNEYLQSRRPQ